MKYFLLLFLSLTNLVQTQAQLLDLSEFVIYSTVPISGKLHGTAFLFSYSLDSADKVIPVIVTNKHIVKDAPQVTILFRTIDSSQNIIPFKTESIILDTLKHKWLFHPDSTIDLAILPIVDVLSKYSKYGIHLYWKGFHEKNIPDSNQRNRLTAIEEIYLIGYPLNLRDPYNNLPIVRKGTTATPAYLNFNKRKEFLCDVPLYKGSSGSPVIIYNNFSMYTEKYNVSAMGTRLYLVGINYATLDRKKMENINVELPSDIGYIIHANCLLDFKPYLKKLSFK